MDRGRWPGETAAARCARALGVSDRAHRRRQARADGRDRGAPRRARSGPGAGRDLPPRRPQHAGGHVPGEERLLEGAQPRGRRGRVVEERRPDRAPLLTRKMKTRIGLLVLLAALMPPPAAEDLLQVYRDAQRYDAVYSGARNSLVAGRAKLPPGRAPVLPSPDPNRHVARPALPSDS